MSGHVELTAAQRWIVEGLLDGLSPQQIALERGASIRTVHWHLGRIYAKTGLHGQRELVLWASEHRSCCLGTNGPRSSGAP